MIELNAVGRLLRVRAELRAARRESVAVTQALTSREERAIPADALERMSGHLKNAGVAIPPEHAIPRPSFADETFEPLTQSEILKDSQRFHSLALVLGTRPGAVSREQLGPVLLHAQQDIGRRTKAVEGGIMAALHNDPAQQAKLGAMSGPLFEDAERLAKGAKFAESLPTDSLIGGDELDRLASVATHAANHAEGVTVDHLRRDIKALEGLAQLTRTPEIRLIDKDGVQAIVQSVSRKVRAEHEKVQTEFIHALAKKHEIPAATG